MTALIVTTFAALAASALLIRAADGRQAESQRRRVRVDRRSRRS